ncbi:hypothetical protein HELRODRAFT_180964 [Helobdella robusta]|uniref:Uncharacterized protein n=1 Tax=Helobdella robusta TaxID=6412 RepID=T1FGG8_HELRO|nr:hypothetical protein HELRODRAFT_180964 [Helobdella robusta]ESN93427.1 hypothetical protein HELRODRAFT_180964 [Helobdella robusta]
MSSFSSDGSVDDDDDEDVHSKISVNKSDIGINQKNKKLGMMPKSSTINSEIDVTNVKNVISSDDKYKREPDLVSLRSFGSDSSRILIEKSQKKKRGNKNLHENSVKLSVWSDNDEDHDEETKQGMKQISKIVDTDDAGYVTKDEKPKYYRKKSVKIVSSDTGKYSHENAFTCESDSAKPQKSNYSSKTVSYKYPSTFHRCGSSRSTSIMSLKLLESLANRLPSSLRSISRYGYEPRLLSCGSSEREGHISRQSEPPSNRHQRHSRSCCRCPPRTKTISTNCEILKYYEKSEKPVQATVKNRSVSCQKWVETSEKSTQRPKIKPRNASIQTAVATTKDHSTQAASKMRSRMTETCLKTLNSANNVDTRNNWTQYDFGPNYFENNNNGNNYGNSNYIISETKNSGTIWGSKDLYSDNDNKRYDSTINVNNFHSNNNNMCNTLDAYNNDNYNNNNTNDFNNRNFTNNTDNVNYLNNYNTNNGNNNINSNNYNNNYVDSSYNQILQPNFEALYIGNPPNHTAYNDIIKNNNNNNDNNKPNHNINYHGTNAYMPLNSYAGPPNDVTTNKNNNYYYNINDMNMNNNMNNYMNNQNINSNYINNKNSAENGAIYIGHSTNINNDFYLKNNNTNNTNNNNNDYYLYSNADNNNNNLNNVNNNNNSYCGYNYTFGNNNDNNNNKNNHSNSIYYR